MRHPNIGAFLLPCLFTGRAYRKFKLQAQQKAVCAAVRASVVGQICNQKWADDPVGTSPRGEGGRGDRKGVRVCEAGAHKEAHLGVSGRRAHTGGKRSLKRKLCPLHLGDRSQDSARRGGGEGEWLRGVWGAGGT